MIKRYYIPYLAALCTASLDSLCAPCVCAGQQMSGAYGSNAFGGHTPRAEHQSMRPLYNSLLPAARAPPAAGPYARSLTVTEVRHLGPKA